ncbi:MAG: hypothetical protein KBD67_08745, partial [Anaerolineaceae bacterium]|nr:hypothetical protein [Anaerolineaceae bacterium]
EMHEGNLPWHILFGFRDSMVTMTMVDGKVLMYDREIKVINEYSIMNEATEVSQEIWKRYYKQFKK